ncbi:iron-sulfur cluster repair di-iron protein [Polaribacter pacificus]|uniref:Iron-sulfur cluster repair di-iron protein n=1 Tax=Polaribacter pacificus TaxID=1775173 RepID=A0A917HX60_9FLAO|nr:iron-sulfur cluster repair di-iron protein [Polaribacter pacificus]GGG95327.1 iron-sulfur cluster repair di-iron protein [Polaribacter pacificus]
MQIQADTLVSDIVAKNYNTAAIFSKYNIDFCCNGNRSLAKVIEKKGIPLEEIIEALAAEVDTRENQSDLFQKLNIGALSDYVVESHHSYVEKSIPPIKQYLDKLCKVHGDRHPELFEIRELFFGSADELTKHMKKEELILFPFFKKLAKLKKEGGAYEKPHFETVENPIAMMHHEHDVEGERFRKIAELTANYTPPADACTTYKVTFSMLKEFEEDLHKHIHLENNILFKRGILLEQELAG